MPELPQTAAEIAEERIARRRAEVAQYDENIDIYQTMKSTLPSDWPDHLVKFKGATNHHAAVAEVGVEDVELLAQLLLRDHCDAMTRSEMVERTKSAAILAALEARRPV